MEGIASSWYGQLCIYDLTTGGLWKEYKYTTDQTFPYRGLRRAVYNGGLIVGDFTYEPLYGQEEYRGLCIIDTATDIISYERPTWATTNDYQLRDITLTDDGCYFITAGSYGMTLFDGTIWTLYDNDNLPGMTTSGVNDFSNPVVYNPTTRMAITGSGQDYADAWSGLTMFSRDGFIKQANYRIGILNGSTWAWSVIAPLVLGFVDYNASLAFDPADEGLYAFWTNRTNTELSTKWDKAFSEFDLGPYLLRRDPVERHSTVDPHTGNWDADLRFGVSHGHLFDSSNSHSLLRKYLLQGRLLKQQFGEEIAGVEYWESAHHFTVSYDGELTYHRGTYPTMQVEAETLRRKWETIHIVASEHFISTINYDATPESVITRLLVTYAGLDAGDINLGTSWSANNWTMSYLMDYQFVDTLLADAIDMVAVHHGYYIRDSIDGKVEAVKISDANTVSRTYADQTKLFNATPLNRNSSMINQWTVRGEERGFTELLMAEEIAGELVASHRWNTGTKVWRVNYSTGDKVYRNPSMEIKDSATGLVFELAGDVTEQLLDNSHDETDETLWDTYCEIEVDSPDLTVALIATLGVLVGSFFLPDAVVTGGFIFSGGHTIRIGSAVSSIACFVALSILGATANVSYVVHGQPVIRVRRQISATSNDTVFQTKMLGQILADQPFDDPLCVSVPDCQAVADFKKMVGMGERKRWKADMMADLHNEDGDTLSIKHPISGDTTNVFITDLTTIHKMPESPDGDGTFSQSFEGWRLKL